MCIAVQHHIDDSVQSGITVYACYSMPAGPKLHERLHDFGQPWCPVSGRRTSEEVSRLRRFGRRRRYNYAVFRIDATLAVLPSTTNYLVRSSSTMWVVDFCAQQHQRTLRRILCRAFRQGMHNEPHICRRAIWCNDAQVGKLLGPIACPASMRVDSGTTVFSQVRAQHEPQCWPDTTGICRKTSGVVSRKGTARASLKSCASFRWRDSARRSGSLGS
jgi:hypothetical protein